MALERGQAASGSSRRLLLVSSIRKPSAATRPGCIAPGLHFDLADLASSTSDAIPRQALRASPGKPYRLSQV